MKPLRRFSMWLDYECPKPLRWLLYPLLILAVFAIYIMIIAIVFILGFWGFYIIPKALEDSCGLLVAIVNAVFYVISLGVLILGLGIAHIKIWNE